MVQVCSDGGELIARTTDAVDDVIRDAFGVMGFFSCSPIAILLRFIPSSFEVAEQTRKIFTGVSGYVSNYYSPLNKHYIVRVRSAKHDQEV